MVVAADVWSGPGVCLGIRRLAPFYGYNGYMGTDLGPGERSVTERARSAASARKEDADRGGAVRAGRSRGVVASRPDPVPELVPAAPQGPNVRLGAHRGHAAVGLGRCRRVRGHPTNLVT
ncbi:hypothetical protein GCM10027168_55870 [Streptomyces capparidis]